MLQHLLLLHRLHTLGEAGATALYDAFRVWDFDAQGYNTGRWSINWCASDVGCQALSASRAACAFGDQTMMTCLTDLGAALCTILPTWRRWT